MMYLPALDGRTRQLIDLTRMGDKLARLLVSEKKSLGKMQARMRSKTGDCEYDRFILEHSMSYIDWLTARNEEIERQIDYLLMD